MGSSDRIQERIKQEAARRDKIQERVKQEAARKEKREKVLKRAYGLAVNDPNVYAVIEDILEVCGVYRAPRPEATPREVDMAEGFRRVGLHVISRLDSVDGKLYSKFLERYKEERDENRLD